MNPVPFTEGIDSRWSYVKYALALALNGQCEESLASLTRLEAVSDGAPSALLNSWVAWGHKVCGREGLYQIYKDRIEAVRNEHPDALNAGYVYLLALEGDTEGLLDLLTRIVEARSPFTAFISIFAVDYLGWTVSDTMPGHPGYRALRQRLNFPVIDL